MENAFDSIYGALMVPKLAATWKTMKIFKKSSCPFRESNSVSLNLQPNTLLPTPSYTYFKFIFFFVIKIMFFFIWWRIPTVEKDVFICSYSVGISKNQLGLFGSLMYQVLEIVYCRFLKLVYEAWDYLVQKHPTQVGLWAAVCKKLNKKWLR